MADVHIITGAAGFVAHCLIKQLLDAGHEVWGFVRAANGRGEIVGAVYANIECPL